MIWHIFLFQTTFSWLLAGSREQKLWKREWGQWCLSTNTSPHHAIIYTFLILCQPTLDSPHTLDSSLFSNGFLYPPNSGMFFLQILPPDVHSIRLLGEYSMKGKLNKNCETVLIKVGFVQIVKMWTSRCDQLACRLFQIGLTNWFRILSPAKSSPANYFFSV